MPDPMPGDVWRGPVWHTEWRSASRVTTGVVTVCKVGKQRIYYRTCDESTLWSIKRSQWDTWAATAELVKREAQHANH